MELVKELQVLPFSLHRIFEERFPVSLRLL